jgi:hypothetical protein
MDETLDLLRQKAMHARRRYFAGEIDKEDADVPIKLFLAAWNKYAQEKAKAAGRRAPKLSLIYFWESGMMG